MNKKRVLGCIILGLMIGLKTFLLSIMFQCYGVGVIQSYLLTLFVYGITASLGFVICVVAELLSTD